ncbi:RteC domain-containing protein [Algoriphagus sp. D3-2-R+10]|uniref:RteC domain-containing protein n=1 Tax=Algoriphagus aurantiacus TaxID=3103948 RepID=UPI002B36BB86|nr:RteC domain-containing protein [Algoriphagus sp. D3-2-R+10]MEB2778609.1 RteC domain-containing protein [Algoriphagus sp. D3-2-R+10]
MGILTFSDRIITGLKNELGVLKLDGENKLIQFESAFHLVDRAMDKIKLFMDHYEFVSEEEEIEFFKHHMTYFLRESVYFSELFNMESIKPAGSKNEIRKFYEKELLSVQEFLQNNQNLYNYLLMKKENQDRVFFLRSAQAPVYKPNLFWHTLDTRYCTVYTLYCARIMGTLALADYIQDQLLVLHDTKNPIEEERNSPLFWTGKKADLVELVYALKTSNAVNHGNARVSELATFMAEVFGKELQDYYRTFLEIKSRKKNRTVFLDQCKENLEAYMNSFEARG